MSGAWQNPDWRSEAISHVGMKRSSNEDACVDRADLGLWAVADGMGGHEGGEVASAMIVESLADLFPAHDLETYVTEACEILTEVNQRLREYSSEALGDRTIGSTVVLLLASGERAACVWAGDSRIYRLRAGVLTQLTRDHSQVQEMVDRNILSAEDAVNHPMGNVITRAVGSDPVLDLDVLTVDLEPGDSFLLCSDGLTNEANDEEIREAMLSHPPQQSVPALIQHALLNNARDNVTAVVADFRAGT